MDHLPVQGVISFFQCCYFVTYLELFQWPSLWSKSLTADKVLVEAETQARSAEPKPSSAGRDWSALPWSYGDFTLLTLCRVLECSPGLMDGPPISHHTQTLASGVLCC